MIGVDGRGVMEMGVVVTKGVVAIVIGVIDGGSGTGVENDGGGCGCPVGCGGEGGSGVMEIEDTNVGVGPFGKVLVMQVVVGK